MSNTLVIRVMSEAGRSRVELKSTQTYKELKDDIAKRLGIADSKYLQLFKDQAKKVAVKARDTDTLAKAGFRNGDMMHVGNQNTKMTNLPPAPKEIVRKETLDELKKKNEKPDAPKLDSGGHIIKEIEEKKDDGKIRDARGQVISEPIKEMPKKKTEMINKAKMAQLGEDAADFVKHQSFENYLVEQKKKCADKHLPQQKCQNCTAVQTFSYKVKYDCLDHKPFPLGMCNRCLPPAVVLQRQNFRHVDYCSFQNSKEISQFVGAWQQTGMFEQRMAFLYGYYSEHPHIPDGVRVNVEAIYEPPQIGEQNGYMVLDDPGRANADMIAASLGLERIGHIFTSTNKEKIFLTSDQMRQAAKYQQEHLVDHPEEHKVSKWVTVRVELKEDESVGVECYMVSDQMVALERDEVLGDSKDQTKMIIREPQRHEAMPAVLREGAPVKEFEPDFFIVSLASGQPNDNNTQFNILKRYDYPVMNRFGKDQTQIDLKQFLMSSKAMKNQFERFANFQFMLHIANMMDIDTALTIARQIADEQSLDSSLVELFECMF